VIDTLGDIGLGFVSACRQLADEMVACPTFESPLKRWRRMQI